MTTARSSRGCILALEDGTVLSGTAFGAPGTRTGEVVFNTSMTGYQEILTDPSYCGQIVTMTYPLIGNYGVNPVDVESARPFVNGFVIRELARRHSNYRATLCLEDYLAEHNVIGLEGVDTRALAKKLRVDGAMRGAITTEIDDARECVRLAARSPRMVGADLVTLVAPRDTSTWSAGLDPVFTPLRGGRGARQARGRRIATRGVSSGRAGAKPPTEPCRVVALDCGMKRNILRHLIDIGCAVQIVPPTVSVEEVLDYKPDGVFISNGPGDPGAVRYAIELLEGLVGKVPLFGICLGHQLLGLALGAETFKLKFGHRGANHPVRNVATGRVEITSQNHGFAIEMHSLESSGGCVTHVNLNDGTLEGFVHREMPILAVQYHPEASPGPHDATYLFDCFHTMMSSGRAPTAEEMADAQAALQRRHSTSAPSV
jgi:carbamoyl-phosphate synthase small subunit